MRIMVDTNVLISLLDAYDLTKVDCKNGLLVKIAWMRNWFERWVENPSFKKYDLVLNKRKNIGISARADGDFA